MAAGSSPNQITLDACNHPSFYTLNDLTAHEGFLTSSTGSPTQVKMPSTKINAQSICKYAMKCKQNFRGFPLQCLIDLFIHGCQNLRHFSISTKQSMAAIHKP
eukprot:Gb_05478 [translate_table: standard]